MVSDNYRDCEAWVVAGGALTALVAFALTWRHYPAVGAALTLLGLLVAFAAVVIRPYWAAYSWVGLRGAALLAVLVALDDAVEHAFPVGSPLDWFWIEWLYPAVRVIEAIAV